MRPQRRTSRRALTWKSVMPMSSVARDRKFMRPSDRTLYPRALTKKDGSPADCATIMRCWGSVSFSIVLLRSAGATALCSALLG